VDLTQFHDINPNYTTVNSNINKDKTQDAPIGGFFFLSPAAQCA